MSNDTQVMTLTEFLLARIAEDEAEAKRAGADAMVGFRWKHYPEDAYIEVQSLTLAHSRRVLAECGAKRRIVEEHPIYRGPRILAIDSSGTDYGCELCHCIDPIRADGIIEAVGYCTTLRCLALPYADHPGCRDEWKP